MDADRFHAKVWGCVLGAALGDAFGGPFEFGPLERVPALTGGDWIDGLYPYLDTVAPHNVWPLPGGGLPPAGTGTDDVRLDWLFLALAIALGRPPTARELRRAPRLRRTGTRASRATAGAGRRPGSRS